MPALRVEPEQVENNGVAFGGRLKDTLIEAFDFHPGIQIVWIHFLRRPDIAPGNTGFNCNSSTALDCEWRAEKYADNGAYCLKHKINVGGRCEALDKNNLSDIMYDMSVITRDFIKRFSHFKQQAVSGVPVKLKDRNGRRFVFQMEKPSTHSGAGKSLSKGIPLSPEPVDKSEWKGAV